MLENYEFSNLVFNKGTVLVLIWKPFQTLKIRLLKTLLINKFTSFVISRNLCLKLI